MSVFYSSNAIWGRKGGGGASTSIILMDITVIVHIDEVLGY